MFDFIRALMPREEHARGFRYFKEGALPFAAGPTDTWNQAWWCAQLSLLSYTTDAELLRKCLAAGSMTRFVPEGSDPTLLLCAHDAANLFIAFRGTDVVSGADFGAGLPAAGVHFKAFLEDVVIDVQARPARWPLADGPGEVHGGFLERYRAVQAQVRAAVAAFPGHALWLCGHSLGGSLALLASSDHPQARGVYTYGAPMTGNQAFVDSLSVPHARLVDGEDGVAGLSLARLGYVHGGHLTQLAPVHIRPLLAAIGISVPPPASLPLPVVGDVFEGFSEATLAAFSPLLHHSPVLYVAQCQAKV